MTILSALFPPHAPCTTTNAVVAGGACVGTMATQALAPAPALKQSFVAAEKIEPAFTVCAPCSLAAQSTGRDKPSSFFLGIKIPRQQSPPSTDRATREKLAPKTISQLHKKGNHRFTPSAPSLSQSTTIERHARLTRSRGLCAARLTPKRPAGCCGTALLALRSGEYAPGVATSPGCPVVCGARQLRGPHSERSSLAPEKSSPTQRSSLEIYLVATQTQPWSTICLLRWEPVGPFLVAAQGRISLEGFRYWGCRVRTSHLQPREDLCSVRTSRLGLEPRPPTRSRAGVASLDPRRIAIASPSSTCERLPPSPSRAPSSISHLHPSQNGVDNVHTQLIVRITNSSVEIS